MIRALVASVLFSISVFPINKLDNSRSKEGLNLAELVRYEGDWFVAEHRRNVRVVSDSGVNWIETYYQGHGICGSFQWSMKMTNDQSSIKYSAKIKWSGFRSGFKHHRKLPWQPYELIGQWDPQSQTFTWTPNDPTLECTVKTVFHSKDHQVVSFSSDTDFEFPTGAYNFFRLW